jgi:hypothetical protein
LAVRGNNKEKEPESEAREERKSEKGREKTERERAWGVRERG